MDRLAMRNSDGPVSQPMDLQWAEVLHRLATYEDTGMTLEDVEEIARYREHIFSTWSYNRMAEIAAAEQSGRLIVLPCRITDTVFLIESEFSGKKKVGEKVVSALIDHATIGGENGHLSFDLCSENGGWYCAMDLDDFYLTREAAEAALCKEEG